LQILKENTPGTPVLSAKHSHKFHVPVLCLGDYSNLATPLTLPQLLFLVHPS